MYTSFSEMTSTCRCVQRPAAGSGYAFSVEFVGNAASAYAVEVFPLKYPPHYSDLIFLA